MFKKIIRVLKLDKHHRMERFSLTFLTLVVCMSLVVSYAGVINMRANNDKLSTIPLYTESTQSSKTNININVVGVYSNKDKSKAFVLMKTDNIDKISTNADNYLSFLTATDLNGRDRNLKSRPSGSIYVFGTSGYIGVYLVNKGGFPSQILKLTMRSGVELSEVKDTINTDVKGDASFKKYDQWNIFFNPGASGTTPLECLDIDGEPSKLDLYNQTVVANEMKLIAEERDAKLEEMRILLNQVSEYTERLDKTDNMQVPTVPEVIAGDSITKDIDKNVYNVSFNKLVQGGYDFDAVGYDIHKGVLDDLINKSGNKNMTYDQFFAMMLAKRKDSKGISDIISSIKWTLKDGTFLEDLNTGSQTGKYVNLKKDADKLIEGWSSYYTAKFNYQTNFLEKILNLEAMAKHVQESSSVNTSKEAVRLY